MRKTHLRWNPASDTPIVSPKRWLFFAYRFDGRTYITVGYYGESIELAKGKSAYCVWPGSPLLPEAKVVGWLDLEQVFNARVTKCMIRAADRLPPWSNRTVSSMFAYLGRFRMHPFLIRLHGTNEWDWAYWGTTERKEDRVGSVGSKKFRYPKYRPNFHEARPPYKKVHERKDVHYWMDPVCMVLTWPSLMKQLPLPVATVDLGSVPYSRDVENLRYQKKRLMVERRATKVL